MAMENYKERVVLNFGIYLGYAPEQPLSNQGIGRLMAFIIQAIVNDTQQKITIACPKWYIQNLYNLLDDFNISHDSINLITTKTIPIALRARERVKKPKKLFFAKRIWSALKQNGKKHLDNQLIKFMASADLKALYLNGAILALFFLMILIAFPFYLLAKVTIKSIDFVRQKCMRITLLKKYLWQPLAILKHDALANSVYHQIRKNEFAKLNALVNQRHEIKAWYIPCMIWPEIANIKATKIVCAPDVVFFDFPTHFKQPYHQNTLNLIQKTVHAADGLICYSDYVKQQHFIQGLYVNADTIKVVKHGWVGLENYLDKTALTSKIGSRTLLSEYFTKMPKALPYLNNFNITNINFFFYSSQDRPHKNFLNLIKAYEYALRRKYINCKLLITAKITDLEVLQYITNARLQFEIIEMHNVPNNILAALNNLAVCAVNPTYFEGGFPFTFSEAYSVGTPSIMSDIPAVREIIDDQELIDLMLFDPTNYKDMAEKMAWAFNNRELLLEKQKGLAEILKARTWEKVAAEYIETMQQIVASKNPTIISTNESLAQELHKPVTEQEYS